MLEGLFFIGIGITFVLLARGTISRDTNQEVKISMLKKPMAYLSGASKTFLALSICFLIYGLTILL